MTAKLGIFLAGLLATAGLLLGLSGPAGTVLAADATSAGATSPRPADFEAARDRHGLHWLRGSVIAAAARTIGAPVEEVREGLRHGKSLKEIAAGRGVGEEALERGILLNEKTELDKLVAAGKLSEKKAERIMKQLTDHIEQVINHHRHGGPKGAR